MDENTRLRKNLTACAEDYDELLVKHDRLREALERVRDMTYVVGGVRMNTLTMDDIRATINTALQEAGDE